MKIFFSLLTISLNVISASAQWTSSGSNIYWSGAGNVGIGVNAPTYKLDVQSSSNAKFRVKSTTAPNPAIIEVDASGSIGAFEFLITPSVLLRAGTRDNADFSLMTNSVNRFTIKSNGKIGIGTSAPTYDLDVNGIVNATSFYVNGQPLTSSWTSSGSNIFYNTGSVSVGTNSAPAGYKLAVGGKLVAEEVVVKLQANWPDYVFENNYDLMSLEELNLYIQKNKHLPGVPSVAEVEHVGIETGKMNTILLKKIEELTLYIIRQKEELDELKRKLAK